jgi:16S rRNA (guanine527-N7)-methyltransferase
MTLRLNQLLQESGHPPLDAQTAEKFAAYLALLQKWNARTNLTSIRDEEGMLSRHFVESILCAQNLSENINSLLDFGSGAGFPGIPIALIRKELSVTLAESQHKKAAFLREAVRVLGLESIVHSGRAETLTARFDCVTLRAVDGMHHAVSAAIGLLAPQGWLAILTTSEDSEEIRSLAQETAQFDWKLPVSLANGTRRVLLLGQAST